MRVLHLQVIEQAEQERRERWEDREIRVHQNRMRQLCERSPADLAAEAAARHTAAWQRARVRALRQRIHEGVGDTSFRFQLAGNRVSESIAYQNSTELDCFELALLRTSGKFKSFWGMTVPC